MHWGDEWVTAKKSRGSLWENGQKKGRERPLADQTEEMKDDFMKNGG
jgi:hypothetical protein